MKQVQEKLEMHTKDIENMMEMITELQDQPKQPQLPPNLATTNDILIIRNRVEYVETTQTTQKKQLSDLRKQFDELSSGFKAKLENFDEAFIKDLEQELIQLKQDFQLFRVEATNSAKLLNEALLRKADKDDLH